MPLSLHAQPAMLEYVMGAALPQGQLAVNRNVGPYLRTSLSRRDRVVRPRGDLEFFTLGGRSNALSTSETGRYSAASASASLLVGRFTARVTPYALLGLGATYAHTDARGGAIVPSLRAGLGIRYEGFNRALFVEGLQHAILSDRGVGDYSFAVLRPIVIGASFRRF